MSAQKLGTHFQDVDDVGLVVFTRQIVVAEVEAGVQQNRQNVDVNFGNKSEEGSVFSGFLQTNETILPT